MENKESSLLSSALEISDEICSLNIEVEKAEYIIYTVFDLAEEANAESDVCKLIQFKSILTLIAIASDYLSKIKKEAADLKKYYACLENSIKKQESCLQQANL